MKEDEIRVLLIEDHRIVREGLRKILHGTQGIIVVGEAADGMTGLALFEHLLNERGVDVVLTDLSLPGIDGLEVTRRVKALAAQVRVLILSIYADDQYIRGMLDAGADGYLLKHVASSELAQAIHTVQRGETALSPAVAHRVVAQVRSRREQEQRAYLLTTREREILALIATGATSKETARHLGLSVKTVQNHRARILEKLQVTNTVAAINIANQDGLLEPPPDGHPSP